MSEPVTYARAERNERIVTIQRPRHEPPGNQDISVGSADRTVRHGRHRDRTGRARRLVRLPGWPRAAEKVLGGFAPTLRMATFLVVAIAAGLTGILASWGPVGAGCVLMTLAVVHVVVARLNRSGAAVRDTAAR
jgi:hypothetical protein